MLKSLFLSILLLCPFLSWPHTNFEKIPAEDRQRLEDFFAYLMHYSMIGYSLCGNKPVSMETFPALSKIPCQHSVKIFAKYPIYSIVWNGLNAWQRHSHFFSSKNFVFRFSKDFDTVILINKRETLRVIDKNLDLFQKYTHKNQTADKFLEDICYPKYKDYLIHNNIALLGILLGYGKNNSLAFSKKSYLQKLERFKLYESNESLNQFINPGFLIINNGTNKKENHAIKQSLRLAKKNLQYSFKNGDYFKSFIDLFTGENRKCS